jgi:hypothetical protein
MSWYYLYGILAFLVGLLAGFQGVYNRYKKDSIDALGTLPGVAYLFSRGFVPAAVFIIFHAAGLIQTNLPVWSVSIGLGGEALLRTKFYLGEIQKPEGKIEEVTRGLADLLQWYQNRFLESIADSLAESRKRFVNTELPQGMSFTELCTRIMNSLPAYPDEQIRGNIEAEINKLKAEHTAENSKGTEAARLDLKYRLKLGYLVLNIAGKRGTRTLVS